MPHSIDRRAFAALGLAGTAAALGPEVRAQAPGSRAGRKTRVAILLYPGTTVLDWTGPIEALARVPEVEVVLAGKSLAPMRGDSGIVEYRANVTLGEVAETDVLLIPGGAKGMMDAAGDPAIAEWVRRIDASSQYTLGICTGSLLLAHLGLLKGRRATTYWKFTGMLAKDGARFVPRARWVADGKYWTSAGVSAGIDATLALIAELYGPRAAMTAQLAIEYDPQPPFESGSLRTAPPEIVAALGGVV